MFDIKTGKFTRFIYWGALDHELNAVADHSCFVSPGSSNSEQKGWHEQFTGHVDADGKECYEGDIKREMIEHDDGDTYHYFVCVWIKEWAMFCWLSITDGEYQKYLDEGADSLDEVMFWTYAFEAEDIAKSKICGNIYQNPELLKP